MIEPARSFHVGEKIALVALFALALTGLVGTFAALTFIVTALLLIALEPREAAVALRRYWPLLLIPLLAMASTLWSDAPQRTLRAGIQLLLTMAAAVLVAHRLEHRKLIAALFIGFAAVSLLSLPYIPASLPGGNPLIEPFDSKNALGISAHMAFALGLAVMFDREQPMVLRLVAPAAMGYAMILIWLSRSTGAQLALAITVAVFVPLLMLKLMSLRWRVALAILLSALLAIGIVLLPQIEAAIAQFRGEVLNKDATLTGRTYLWEFASRVSEERPLLGHGFYAFWRQGNIDAEGLWRWGGIASRSGFNFHNAFVEMRVDLGLVGMVLLAVSCVVVLVLATTSQIARPSIPTSFFLAWLAVAYFRAFGESNLISPFGTWTMLWVAAGVYALQNARTYRTALPAAGRGTNPGPADRRGRTLSPPKSRAKRPLRGEPA